MNAGHIKVSKMPFENAIGKSLEGISPTPSKAFWQDQIVLLWMKEIITSVKTKEMKKHPSRISLPLTRQFCIWMLTHPQNRPGLKRANEGLQEAAGMQAATC